jgi:hypothetical protein
MKPVIIWLLLGVLTAAQTPQVVDSKVTAATVFKKSALVTRQAAVDIAKGVQTICFSNLTTDLTDKSISVSAGNNAGITILDVNVNQKHTAETQQEAIRILEQKIDSLLAAKSLIEDELTILNSRKAFIESIKPQQPKQEPGKVPDYPVYMKQWSEALDYLNDNLAATQAAIHTKLLEQAGIQAEITMQNDQIAKSKGVVSHDFKEIVVTLQSLRKQKATISASYMVPDAGWFPLYDARVNSVDKINELSYFGMLQQSTGEDWNDISLSLSTSEPLTMKSLPQLNNWFIDLYPIPQKADFTQYREPAFNGSVSYEQNWGLPSGKGSITGYVRDNATEEPLIGANVVIVGTTFGTATDAGGKYYIPNIPAGNTHLKVNSIGYGAQNISITVREKNIATLNIGLHQQDITTAEIMVVAEKPMINKNATNSMSVISMSSGVVNAKGGRAEPREREKYSNISNNELATNFSIPAKYSIPSDKSPHKVTIAIEEMKIDFERSAIPKITPKVLSKGKILNNNKYPWLAGEVNVFVDNDFLNTTDIKTIVPGDSLKFTLGTDELMRVERKLVKKTKEAPGLFSNKIAETFEYEIYISNNRKTEEAVAVTDQLPISSDEEIVVEPVDPLVSLKDLNSLREVKWQLTLKPGERKVIPFKFKISYPKDMPGIGL